MDTIPWASFFGGLLLGLSAVFLFVIHGKVAGISGIINGLLSPVKGDRLWRVLFLVGLTAGGLACLAILDIQVPDTPHSNSYSYSGGLACRLWYSTSEWLYKWTWHMWDRKVFVGLSAHAYLCSLLWSLCG